MRGRILIFISIGFAALAAASAADAQSGMVETGATKSVSVDANRREAVLIPVEQALENLRIKRGWSFIFDSRLIAGKKIAAIKESNALERNLIAALAVVDLQLHQVARNTFAVTSATNPSSNTDVNIIPDESELPVDTILVLGSSTSTPTVTGSKRIFKLDSVDLANLNAATPAEAIYSLPQSLASFTPSNTALYASAAGISLADMRGLGPKRTLVLVNGRRRTITTGGNGELGGVDLGSIAEPLLERIEVLNLPGGARYGASAVAGAVNFVTKSDFSGLEAGMRLGISERGDSEELSFHVVGGEKISNFGALTVGLSISRNEGLVGADRSFSAIPYGFGLNGVRNNSAMAEFLPGFGGSTTTDQGTVAGVILSDGSFSAFPGGAGYVAADDGSIAPFRGALSQLYNWSQWQSVIIPSDRIIGQLSFRTKISETLEYFMETEGGVVAADSILAPLPTSRFRGADPVAGDAAVIPLSNPFLPQSVKDAAQSAFGSEASAVVFERRFAELGPRRQQIDRKNYGLATGVSFEDDASRTLSLSYRFGRTRATSRELDRVDRNKLTIALNPASCAAAPGCALADFFSMTKLSQQTLDFITLPEIARNLTINEHELAANASIPMSPNSDHAGRLSAGVELRRAIFTDRDHTPAGAEPIGYLGGTNTNAALESLEAFAEIDSPAMSADWFPGEVDATLAARLAYATNFNVASNFEVGVDWRPSAGISLFTRQQFGDRTPDIIELYSVGSTLEMSFMDPCGLDATSQSEIVNANCTADGPLGVNPGFVQTSPLASSTFYGNPELRPEHVRSSAYGVSFSPTEFFEALPGNMELNATWLDFKISNSISTRSDVLLDCYSSPGFSAQNCLINPRTGAPSIVRDPATRQIVSYDNILFNDGELQWRGLDLEMRYTIQPERIAFADTIWLSVLHTYTDAVTIRQNGNHQRLDGLLDYPHHRTLASAGLEFSRWSFVAYANRRGKAATVRSLRPEAQVHSALYIDLTSRFEVTESAYLQVGVKNLTDRKPEITAFNEVGNFAPEYYDPIGRRYTLTFRANF